MIALQDSKEPNIFNKALTLSARDIWMKVMEEEIEFMKVNQVWDLVELPSNCKTI